jgi:hypothetical protein
MYVVIDGYWDNDNQWVAGGYAPALEIKATPIPIGDVSGTHGQSLSPDPYGERFPAMMRFTGRTEMLLNSLIIHGSIPYKITRRGDYHTAGYWQAVGQTIPNFDLQDINPAGYEITEGVTLIMDSNGQPITLDNSLEQYDSVLIYQGARQVPLSQLLKAQEYVKSRRY